MNFHMYNLDLEKAEEPEIKLPTSFGSWKKQESSRETSTLASLTMLKPLIVWITTKCGQFFKRWEYQTTLLASCSNCCFLTRIQISQEASKVVWYSHLLKNFPQFVVIHTVRDFSVVNETDRRFVGTLLLFP